MGAKELRIGNYINLTRDYFKNIKVFQLDAFDIYKLSESECKDIKPIPLTEEWLLKFGLQRRKGIKEKYIYHNFSRKFMLSESKDDVFNLKFIAYKIHYVHQLQNLYFALTNEELKIK